MNVLVTGGAGYIGSHCVYELCDAGHNVSVLDNFSLGLRENLDPRVQNIYEGDVRNKTDLDVALKGKDVVFHFAAWKAAGESMLRPGKYAGNNICGSLNLLAAMVEHNVSRIVFSSSAAVYGDPQYLPIDEKHFTDPMNYYGYSKLAIEQNLYWYSRLKGIHFAALRYFNATGYDLNGRVTGKEINPQNLSPIVMEVASGVRPHLNVFGNDYPTDDGTCIRDYIHVNDLAKAHLLAMEYVITEHQNLVVNLGSEKGYSVLEMIRAAENALNMEIPYKITGRREGDPVKLVASSELAKKQLGWQAHYSDPGTIFESMAKVYLSDK